MSSSQKTIDNNKKLNAMDVVLNEDIMASAKPNWTKLMRSDKLSKLKQYSMKYCETNNIDASKSNKLFQMFKNKLNQGRLANNKDIIYDIETQVITNIPLLQYNSKTNAFILKRSEKRKNTLRSLTPAKKN